MNVPRQREWRAPGDTPWRGVPLSTGNARDLLADGMTMFDALTDDPVPTLRWYRSDAPTRFGGAILSGEYAVREARQLADNVVATVRGTQLAPFRYRGDPAHLPGIWEAQSAALAVPGTGMAVTGATSNRPRTRNAGRSPSYRTTRPSPRT